MTESPHSPSPFLPWPPPTINVQVNPTFQPVFTNHVHERDHSAAFIGCFMAGFIAAMFAVEALSHEQKPIDYRRKY